MSLRRDCSKYLGLFAVTAIQFTAPADWTKSEADQGSLVWSHGPRESAPVLALSTFKTDRRAPLKKATAKAFIQTLERVRSQINQSFGISDFHVETYRLETAADLHVLTMSGSYIDGDRGGMRFYERQIFVHPYVYQLQLSYQKASPGAPSETAAAKWLDGMRVVR
jgi:hypothetical protein